MFGMISKKELSQYVKVARSVGYGKGYEEGFHHGRATAPTSEGKYLMGWKAGFEAGQKQLKGKIYDHFMKGEEC